MLVKENSAPPGGGKSKATELGSATEFGKLQTTSRGEVTQGNVPGVSGMRKTVKNQGKKSGHGKQGV